MAGRQRVLGGVVAGLAAAGLVLAAGSVPHEPNVEVTQLRSAGTPVTEAIEQLSLSDRLADFGELHKDPVALVEAAMIRKQAGGVLKHTGTYPEPRTWESLLTAAAQVAGPNPTIAGLIADVRAYKVRNIPTINAADASLLNKSIKQRGADRVEVRFEAGQPAVVYVHPVPAVNLGLFVYDEYNNLICTGEGESHEAQCRWRPRWNGSYLVDVRNNNDTEVAYVLAINREIGAH
jgi:hypothetical protein